MIHYNSYRSYIQKRFGAEVLKVPLNASFSCPNRDGSKSSSGCSFCDNRAFSPAALSTDGVISQLTAALRAGAHRFSHFIAYLQPFTNTYAPLETLASLYESILALPGVVGLAIGTRPDCLPDDVIDYLGQLNKKSYISVELGLQSASNETLARNNRGHTYEEFAQAVEKLSREAIECVAHVILGLPSDTRGRMLATAEKLASLPVHGIKIHQLMVISNTTVESWYRRGEIEPLTLEGYTELLCEFISRLRPDQYIHRIMADSTPRHGLIAPLWSSEKNRSIAYIHSFMEAAGIVQGSRYQHPDNR